MGDQSLGRLIKKRRDTLGFSQARLGELVGRSASTIRNWERGKSTPANPSDAIALAAVLGLEEAEVLQRAGFEDEVPSQHQTVEQAYASLAPEEEVAVDEPPSSQPVTPVEAEPETVPEPEAAPVADSESSPTPTPQPEPVPDPTEPATDPEPESTPDTSPPPPTEKTPASDDRPRRERRTDRPWEPVVRSARPESPRRLVAVQPVDEEPADSSQEREVARAARPTVLEMAPPEEKSYIEDPEERQRYRSRAVATAVIIVFLAIVLIWSFERATDALGDMWSDFVDLLEF